MCYRKNTPPLTYLIAKKNMRKIKKIISSTSDF